MAHPDNNQATLRRAYYAVFALMALQFVLSIIWYKQRTLFTDPAWMSFDVLNRRTFSFTSHRYSAAITQFWVWAGERLHWPVSVILTVYSASFSCIYLLIAMALWRLRQYVLGILLGLYFTLFASDIFFWPTNEVHMGIAFAMLFLGLFFHYQPRDKMPAWMHLALLISLFIALFSHFVVYVPFSFLALYQLLYRGKELWGTPAKKIQLIVYALAGIMLFLLKLKLGSAGGYDSEKLAPVLHANLDSIKWALHNEGARTMVRLIRDVYWIVIPIAGISGLVLLRQRRWRLLALFAVYVIGFFDLVCLTYHGGYGRELRWYMEGEWMAWGILLATPAVVHALGRVRPSAALVVLSVVFAVRMGYVFDSYLLFNSRYRTQEAIVDKLHHEGTTKALILAGPKESTSIFLNDWASPYESLLLSGIKGYHPKVSYYIVAPDFEIPEPNKHLFLQPYGRDSATKLNHRYFDVDGKSPYRVLKLAEVTNEVRE